MRRLTVIFSLAFLVAQAGVADHENAIHKSDYFYYEAVNLMNIEEFDAAFDLLCHCYELNPTAGVKYQLSKFYLYFGLGKQEQEGVRLIEEAIAQEPSNYWYWNVLAQYYLKTYKVPQAVELLERMARQFPNRQSVLMNLYDVYMESGNTAGALQVLDNIESILGESDSELRLMRFQTLLQCDRISDAYSVMAQDMERLIPLLFENMANQRDLQIVRRLCRFAIADAPSSIIYYYYMALSHSIVQEYSESLSWVEQGIKVVESEGLSGQSLSLAATVASGSDEQDRNPSSPSALYGFRGDLLHEMGRHEESYQAYQEAIAFNPDDYLSLNNLAYFMALDGKELDKALSYSKHVIDAYPRSATYLDTYAWILFRSGKYADARVYIDKALQCMSQESADVLDHAGDIYFFSGLHQEALQYWNQAYKLNPSLPNLEKKIIERKYVAPQD